MPTTERLHSAVGRDEHQGGGAKNVANENPGAPENQESNSFVPAQSKDLPEDDGHHDPGLERLHSAAGFVHADKGAAQLDDIAELIRSQAEPAGDLHGHIGHCAHHVLNDEIFELDRPRHGHERKTDGKREVLEPSRAACPEKRDEGKIDYAKGEEPAQQPPVGIGLFDYPKRKEHEENLHHCQSRYDAPPGMEIRRGTSLPAEIENQPAVERHGPSVADI